MNNYHNINQYFIGNPNQENILNYHKLYSENKILSDEKKLVFDRDMLYKHSVYGCFFLFDDKTFTAKELVELNKKCEKHFTSFMVFSWDKSAFSSKLSEMLNTFEELKKFFAWVYLPSENCIRCYSRNIFFKSNIDSKQVDDIFFDIPLDNLNYFAFSHEDFDLDEITSCVDENDTEKIHSPICYIKITHKSKIQDYEKNRMIARFRHFGLISEAHHLDDQKLESDEYIIRFHKLRILNASNNKLAKNYFDTHFRNKEEEYVSFFNDGFSKKMASALQALYKKYQIEEVFTKNTINIYLQPYKKHFEKYLNIISYIDENIDAINSQSELTIFTKNLDKYIINCKKLEKTIKQIENEKIDSQKQIRFEQLKSFCINQMELTQINDTNEKFEKLIKQESKKQYKKQIIWVASIFLLSFLIWANSDFFKDLVIKKETPAIDSSNPKQSQVNKINDKEIVTDTQKTPNTSQDSLVNNKIGNPPLQQNEENNEYETKKEQIGKNEKEKLNNERIAKLENERTTKIEKDKLEKERIDKLEKERLAKIEKDKLDKERIAKLEKERMAKIEAEKKAREENKVDWVTYNNKMNRVNEQINLMNSIKNNSDREPFIKDIIVKLEQALKAKPNDPEASRLLKLYQ